MKLWHHPTPRRSYGDILFTVSLWVAGLAVAVSGCVLYAGYLIFLTKEGSDASVPGRSVVEVLREGTACRAELLAYERFLGSQRVRKCKVERLRRLFDVLSDSLPQGVWVSSVETIGQRIRIKGHAFVEQGISLFLEAIREKAHGENVVVEASRAASEESENQREFVISLNFRSLNDCVNDGVS